MPNHVINKMLVRGEYDYVEKFFESIKNETEAIDFNKIIQRPAFIELPEGVDGIPSHISDFAEILMIKSGHDVFGYDGKKKTELDFFDYNRKYEWSDEDFCHLVRCCKAIRDCGFSNWHPWSCVKWGTKWNAYSVSRESNEVVFQTAWSTPIGIWERIACDYKNISLKVYFADEDIGSNCGILRVENGDVSAEQINTDEFANSIWNKD